MEMRREGQRLVGKRNDEKGRTEKGGRGGGGKAEMRKVGKT